MSPDAKEDLLKVINASGFLFQLRVEDEIVRTSASHHKSVLAVEHMWSDEFTGEEGFIDLILQTGTQGRIVVECKRVIDATWHFLVPIGATPVKRANILWSYKFDDHHQVAAWDELNLGPESMESSFCIVRGQGEKDQPMLERLTGVLLHSTECFATEEQNYHRPSGLSGIRFYFPVVITTAKLKICKCDFSKINLSTGQILDAEFEDVPFLRFTKSMSTQLPSSNPPENLSLSMKGNQRTVFIINADSLSTTLLNKWEFLKSDDDTKPWPWDLPIWKDVHL